MSAHTLPIDLYRALSVHFGVTDPGASGTFQFTNKGLVTVPVVTAGAESRALPTATKLPLGLRLIVFLKTAGGDLTITGAASSVVLTTAGQAVEFIVADNDGTRVWRELSNTSAAGATPVDTSTQTTLPTGTGDIADIVAAIAEITTALVTAGIITDAYPDPN